MAPPGVDDLLRKPVSNEHPQVLRTVSPARVLKSFGSAFEGGGSASKPSQADHEEADAVWSESAVSTEVDVFVAHSSGAPRWKKALGMYYYLNANTAMAASVVTWATLLLLLLLVNGATTMGGAGYLTTLLVFVPTAVFFVALFTAHLPRTSVRLWLDKLCVHQTNHQVKTMGRDVMMEAAGGSDRMCVLLDETFFERLWCSAEAAAFGACKESADRIDFVPLWIPPLIMVTFILHICCASLVGWLNDYLMASPEFLDMYYALYGTSPDFWRTCLANVFSGALRYVLGFAPLLIPSYFLLTGIVAQCSAVMSQMRPFQHDQTQCAKDADWAVVKKLMRGLFRQQGDSEDQALDRYDSFMSLKLAPALARQVTSLRMRETFLMVLPLAYSASANVLGCFGKNCGIAAVHELPPPSPESFFDMMTSYVVINGLCYSFCSLLCYPVLYPMMLLLVEKAMQWQRIFEQLPLVVLSIVISFFWMGASVGLMSSVMVFAVMYGGVYIAAAAVSVLVYAAIFVWFMRSQLLPWRDDNQSSSSVTNSSTGYTTPRYNNLSAMRDQWGHTRAQEPAEMPLMNVL